MAGEKIFHLLKDTLINILYLVVSKMKDIPDLLLILNEKYLRSTCIIVLLRYIYMTLLCIRLYVSIL